MVERVVVLRDVARLPAARVRPVDPGDAPVIRLRSERGMTVVELLVAMTMSAIVFTATLQVYEGTTRQSQRSERTVEAAEQARVGVTQLVRTLREASGWQVTGNSPEGALLRTAPTDLVYGRVKPAGAATVDNPRAIEAVRYCLEASTGTLW